MRVRWYRAAVKPADLKRIGEEMLKHEFTRKSITGFRLEHRTTRRITGRYVERSDWIDEVQDPFGRVTRIDRFSYEVVRFRLTTDSPGLELRDPPRTLRSFVARLGEYTNFAITLEEVKVDPFSWMHSLREQVRGVEVRAVSSSPFAVARYVTAQVKLKGSKEVATEYRRMTEGKETDVSKLTVTWPPDVLCELSRSGRATVTTSRPERTVEALRRALREAADV